MFGVMNPWPLVALLLALGSAGGFGFKLGADSVKAQLYTQAEAAEVEQKRLQKVAQTYAMEYEKTRQEADNTAANLRKQLNEKRNQLAHCDGRYMRLNADYVRLYNAALQAKPRDSAESAGAATGAADAGVTPEQTLEVAIENGKRWKSCRDQLNALIEVVK